MVKQHVARCELFAHNGYNPPRKRKLIPNLFVGRHTDNIHRRTEARYHTNCFPGKRACNNSLCGYIYRHTARSVGNGVHLVCYGKFRISEAFGKVYMPLGFFHNLAHCAHRFNGVFARSGFTRKHNCACAVIHGVCNVGYFRTRRAGVVNHRFQHFGCGYNALAQKAAFCNNVFLQRRKLCKRNLYTQIAAAYHYSVALGAYIVYIINSGTVFYFCYYGNVAAAVFAEKAFKVKNILFGGNKRSRNVIHPVFYTEKKVTLVLLT